MNHLDEIDKEGRRLTMDRTRELVIIDAPSNLGLRPPAEGSVPGCCKMPWALHDRGIVGLLGATYAGVVVPPRYEAAWKPGDGDRNAAGIAAYSERLGRRVASHAVPGKFVLVIGGDCSVLIGNALALRKRGRFGLVFIDAHSDYRHPGNSKAIGAAAGEDLAIVTGKGDPRLIDIGGRGPYVDPKDVIVLGVLECDEDIPEMAAAGMKIFTNRQVRQAARLRSRVDALLRRVDRFWIHLDFDCIDRSQMTAVDCPEETGTTFEVLAQVLAPLVALPACAGMEITIYDPDLDPDGSQCDRIVHFLRHLFPCDP